MKFWCVVMRHYKVYIIIEWKSFIAFIFNNHVVHHKACLLNMLKRLMIPKTSWLSNNCNTSLEHSKCLLHVLPSGLLSYSKIDSFLAHLDIELFSQMSSKTDTLHPRWIVMAINWVIGWRSSAFGLLEPIPNIFHREFYYGQCFQVVTQSQCTF